MELLESDDPVKIKLLQKATRHREALEEEVSEISDRTEKVLTNALIIGGALALTYMAVQHFSGPKKKKSKKSKTVKNAEASGEEEENESGSGFSDVVSQIGSTLASQASVFLLNLAKEKLMEYLESQNQKADENS